MKLIPALLVLCFVHALIAGEKPALILAQPFRDHMVLQREMPVPVWGTAAAGDEVTVTFANQTKKAHADATGKWTATLDPMPASAEPRELTIACGNPQSEIKNQMCSDVLVGEVWLCSQSNMEWVMGKVDRFPGVPHGEEEIAKPVREHLRIFSDDGAGVWEKRGWQRCGGEALRRFSATAFFFGDALHRELQVPVGLINVSRGGSSIQAWTRREFAQRDPFTKHYLDLFRLHVKEISAHAKAVVEARRTHRPEPAPLSSELTLASRFPGSVLYDLFVEPLAPYAVRGVIWYQGEANASAPETAQAYGSMLRVLIEGWRARWGQPEMPWHVVQLPCWNSPLATNWPAVRQGQWEAARALPGVGLATICDVADATQLHPPQKLETGERLARLALAKTYGKVIPGTGPQVKSLRRAGASVLAEFDGGGAAITLKGGAWNDVELAGADGTYHSAKATIQGDTASIVSDAVGDPKAIRYGWRAAFTPTLFNSAGLPAAPFALLIGDAGKLQPGLAVSSQQGAVVRSKSAPAQKPNIIVILADDLGWGDLGCYPKGEAWGEEAKVATPNIDALAASGVRCTQGYATCMVCSPSRAALLSGQYQQRFGFYGFGEANVPFPTRLKLLPETLREDGYSTAMAGKWHISFAPESTPLKRGFDRFFGMIGGQHDYFDAGLGQPMHGVSNAADAFLKDQEKNVGHIKYLTDELTDRALGFLGEARKQPRPFFLYLPYNAPHPPMQAAWQDLEPFAKLRPKERFNSRDIARAMIANLDANVGRVMRWLHENDLEKNTLVFFTSDNGGADDGPGHVTQHNGGLRGRKGYFYEGGIRIPYIVSWPGTLPAGATFEQPVSHLDIYATAAAGHAHIGDLHLDGVNLIPHLTLKDTSAPHAQMFWSVQTPLRWAVREGDWKLVREDLTPTLLQLRSPSKFKLQLYNITEDRNETHDLAEEKPETVARLQKLFDGFLAQSQPTTFTPAVNAANKAAVAARQKNPALREQPRSDGAPGHWIGGGAKERLAKEQAGE